ILGDDDRALAFPLVLGAVGPLNDTVALLARQHALGVVVQAFNRNELACVLVARDYVVSHLVTVDGDVADGTSPDELTVVVPVSPGAAPGQDGRPRYRKDSDGQGLLGG